MYFAAHHDHIPLSTLLLSASLFVLAEDTKYKNTDGCRPVWRELTVWHGLWQWQSGGSGSGTVAVAVLGSEGANLWRPGPPELVGFGGGGPESPRLAASHSS